jgi:tetratricopeptide (TPR) repeat protein
MNELQLTSELLNQFVQMKWILISILIVFCLVLIGVVYLVWKVVHEIEKDSNLNIFKNRASELLTKGDLEAVIEFSNKKLKNYPMEMWAHWFLAQAYYRQKEYQKSLESLNVIAENAPSWKEQYVAPHIAEIKEKLKNTKPEIVNND